MSTTGSETSQGVKGEYPVEEGYNSTHDSDKTYTFSIWPDGPDFTYQSTGEWQMSLKSAYSGDESIRGEAEEPSYFMYSPREEEEEGFGGEVEEEEEKEKVEYFEDRKGPKKRRGRNESDTQTQDTKNKALFVHSLPDQFPDVTKTRKSAFGSIFLKTSREVSNELVLLRSIANNSYVLISSLLDSFEKIIEDAGTDPERRRFTVYFKESLQKTLEAHGMSRTYSDGSVHWDIYPITEGYLFSVHLKNRLHQTRNLVGLEHRIVRGPTKILKFPISLPTKSVWSGYWNSLGMTYKGIYNMPHGVSYFGKMKDGMFHDTNATLTYPNKFKALNCVFEEGKLLSCQFQFPDMLVYEDNWKYCQFPDRRFWSEVQNGLKSAKIAQRTQTHPPRRIPAGCYDTGDGFYNPKTLMLESPSGKLLRVPVCEEDLWIKKYCRKGFLEYSDFRPDLFENWFNYDQDLINLILEEQAAYRAGKITYNDLQQFYADLDLLPTFFPYKKRKSPTELENEEFMKSIPEPLFLREKSLKKFVGHKILKNSSVARDFSYIKKESLYRASVTARKKGMSKVSLSSKVKSETSEVSETGRRKISEKYLEYRPLLKLPFEPRRRVQPKKCIPRKSSSSSSSEISPPRESGDESYIQENQNLERKNLEKFIKKIILDLTTKFLIKERERHRKRYTWGQKYPQKKKEGTENESLRILKQLFDSIPDTDEFCDSEPKQVCDLKELAKDKYNMLKYWGARILTLDFDEKPLKLSRPKIEKLDLTMSADAELLFASFLKK